MKTNTFLKSVLFATLLMCVISCKKSDSPKSSSSGVDGTWSTSIWGGVNGNICTFTISSNATTGVITQLGSQPFNFAVGDQLYTGITASSSGTYNATGKYTYGANNAQSSTRPCTLTLSNNNATLTADYPPITSGVNTGFGEIIYVFQRQ